MAIILALTMGGDELLLSKPPQSVSEHGRFYGLHGPHPPFFGNPSLTLDSGGGELSQDRLGIGRCQAPTGSPTAEQTEKSQLPKRQWRVQHYTRCGRRETSNISLLSIDSTVDTSVVFYDWWRQCSLSATKPNTAAPVHQQHATATATAAGVVGRQGVGDASGSHDASGPIHSTGWCEYQSRPVSQCHCKHCPHHDVGPCNLPTG